MSARENVFGQVCAALAVACLVLCQIARGGVEVAAGATKKEVLEVLGRPNYAVGSGNKETLGYDDVKVVLVNGVVVQADVSRNAPAEDGPATADTRGGDKEVQQRKRLQERYVKELREELLREPKAECRRLARELRKAEVAVHRLKRKSAGLVPAKPLASASRHEWDSYARELAKHKTLTDEIASDLQTAERERDRLQALYEDAKEQCDGMAGCDVEELYGLLEKSAWKQPGPKVGYVGVIGHVTVLKRIDDARSLWLCSGLPTNSTVLASGFEGTRETVEEQGFFPGVVEVVALRESPELGKTIFEVRPYVRDTSTERE